MRTPNLTKISLSELRGISLVIIGIAALIFYYSWWFQNERLLSFWLAFGFGCALFYGTVQILAGWLVYLGTHRRPVSSTSFPTGLTIDVFVTAYRESPEMIMQCLAAACAMRGAHNTWLLDDGSDPVLADLAEKLGAGYLTRRGNSDAKAGNVNAALARTNGDIVVIFDVDHVPQPDFLEKTIGCFNDSSVGFVQVMPTFYNDQDHGWVARAATETSFDFYNPTSKGMDGFSSVTKMGTNSLIRRTALNSIGGYQPGLAEDLATSIALHAAGWKSRYVAEPLAPGLAPPDLSAWFTQQLKWARGVFEVLVVTFPTLFRNLSWGQRLSYTVRTTNYLLGPVIFVHITALIAILHSDNPAAHAALQQYFIYLTPLALMEIIIRQLALRKWRHTSMSTSSMWRATTLVFNTWPIYTFAWTLAIFRLPLSFRPTPKDRAGSVKGWWVLPQLITAVLLMSGVFYSLVGLEGSSSFYLLYGFAVCFAIPQTGLLRPLLRPVIVRNNGNSLGLDKVNSRTTAAQPRSNYIQQ